MGKIIKNNVTYGGVPDEVITAWETEDVQDLPELAYGDADISDIGDGSITGAIAEHESEISELNSKTTPSGQHSLLNGTLRWRTVGNICQITLPGLDLQSDLNNRGLPSPVDGYFLMALVYSNAVVAYVQYNNGSWTINKIGTATTGYGSAVYIASL